MKLLHSISTGILAITLSACNPSVEDGFKLFDEKKYQEAIDVLSNHKENNVANLILYKIYVDGLGVNKNNNLAIEHLKTAAAANNYEAMEILADTYINGLNGIQKNPKKGIEILEELSRQGQTNANLKIGEYYSSLNDQEGKKKARENYLKTEGTIKGNFAISLGYEWGMRGFEQNPERAYALLNDIEKIQPLDKEDENIKILSAIDRAEMLYYGYGIDENPEAAEAIIQSIATKNDWQKNEAASFLAWIQYRKKKSSEDIAMAINAWEKILTDAQKEDSKKTFLNVNTYALYGLYMAMFDGNLSPTSRGAKIISEMDSTKYIDPRGDALKFFLSKYKRDCRNKDITEEALMPSMDWGRYKKIVGEGFFLKSICLSHEIGRLEEAYEAAKTSAKLGNASGDALAEKILLKMSANERANLIMKKQRGLIHDELLNQLLVLKKGS